MKIKSDFVTNSSSTNYLIIVPESVSSENLLKRYNPEGTFLDEYDEEVEINMENMISYIESLKKGGNIYREEMISDEYEILYDTLERAGLILTSVDCQGDDVLSGIEESHFNVFAEGLKRDFNIKDHCPQCNGEGNDPHTCPRKVELNEDERECTCCDDCTKACMDEI